MLHGEMTGATAVQQKKRNNSSNHGRNSVWCLVCNAMNAVALVLMFRSMILQPLKMDETRMRHWDPTEIIATNLPLHILFSFVAASFAITMTMSSVASFHEFAHDQKIRNTTKTTVKDSMLSLFIGSFVICAFSVTVTLFIFFLCGDTPYHLLWHSILASTFATTLSLGPSFVRPGFFHSVHPFIDLILGKDNADHYDNNNIQFSSYQKDTIQVSPIHRFQLYSCILCTIPCAIFLILDHGNQIQRWPVPILLGFTIGFTVGTLLCPILNILSFKCSF